MKILIDECITKRLKVHLEEFDVATVKDLNLSGTKNGKLMAYCVENNFDILLTIDKSLIYQQNLEQYPLIIVVLNSRTSKIEDLVSYLPAFKLQVPKFQKHNFYIIDK